MRNKLAIALAVFAFAVSATFPAAAVQDDEAAKQSKKEKKADKKARKQELFKTATPVVWKDPGNVSQLDFVGGVGGRDGAPVPPFTFVEEKFGGTAPKLDIKDARGRTYGVKFGGEVKSEVVASRIAWAAGYLVEPAYYVANGRIEGVTSRKRTKYVIDGDGNFEEARFEAKLDDLGDFEDEESWDFDSGPFANTKELNGLKVVIMVTSNWDNKDVDDAFRGSNTKIYLMEVNGRVEAWYMMTDWGGSMGKFGGFFGRNKWDSEGYLAQSSGFVTRGPEGLDWAYGGQHGKSFWRSVRAADANWIAGYLEQITDDQLRSVILSVNGSQAEVQNFTNGFRQRVAQLKALR
jgi:hypothetical protein